MFANLLKTNTIMAARGRTAPRNSAQDPWPKVVKSAVILMPPLWDPIQDIRRVHDKGYVRWMPHINLLYPFAAAEKFGDVVDGVKEAVKNIEPFTVRFSKFEHFKHGSYCTLWLGPETENQNVHRLQAALEAAFPHCDELGKLSDAGFTPHLSVGNDFTKLQIKSAQAEFQADWKPIEFTCSEIYMIGRLGFEDPFEIYYRVPFGSEPVEQLKAPPAPSQATKKAADPKTLFVANIPHQSTEEGLMEFFGNAGLVPSRINLIKDGSGKLKNFCFVAMDSESDAQRAISSLDGQSYLGRPLKVAPGK